MIHGWLYCISVGVLEGLTLLLGFSILFALLRYIFRKLEDRYSEEVALLGVIATLVFLMIVVIGTFACKGLLK
jgi:hypothetical protein